MYDISLWRLFCSRYIFWIHPARASIWTAAHRFLLCKIILCIASGSSKKTRYKRCFPSYDAKQRKKIQKQRYMEKHVHNTNWRTGEILCFAWRLVSSLRSAFYLQKDLIYERIQIQTRPTFAFNGANRVEEARTSPAVQPLLFIYLFDQALSCHFCLPWVAERNSSSSQQMKSCILSHGP